MQLLPKGVRQSGQSAVTREDAHWREAVFVWHLRKELHSGEEKFESGLSASTGHTLAQKDNRAENDSSRFEALAPKLLDTHQS